MKAVKYRGWKILHNERTGYYDLYTPDDAECYSNKDLAEYCTAEMEDIPTIDEAKDFIRKY